MPAIRIIKAMHMAPGMDRHEVDRFLAESKTPLRLATTNAKGEPNIHPVWYEYMNEKLYFMSNTDAAKIRNIKHSKTIYFSIDTDAMPNTGVKGRGTATIIKDTSKALLISEKIVGKYLGDISGKMAKAMIDEVRKGSELLVEIIPHFFSVWDYTKSKL